MKWLWILLLCITFGRLEAAPLRLSHLQGAKRLLIMPGTFNPLHRGHIEAAKSALEASAADYVIILPNESPKKKETLSYEERLGLIAQAIHNEARLLYPENMNFAELQTHLRENPGLQISLVVGSDIAERPETSAQLLELFHAKKIIVVSRGEGTESAWLTNEINTSSTAVKKILAEHPELYLSTDPKKEYPNEYQALLQVLAEDTIDSILDKKFYAPPSIRIEICKQLFQF